MPSLLSLKHEMHQPRPQGFSIKKALGTRLEMDKNRSECRPRGETTTWKRRGWSSEIRIKFSLIKKINLGVAYALFHPSSIYRCFLMKFAEGMKSVINISRAQDKEKIWIPDNNWTYMTYRTPVGCTKHWATLDLWRAGPYTRLTLITCVLLTARISDFDRY